MILPGKLYVFLALLSTLYLLHAVEVHFEATDSGFFLKHTKQPPVAPDILNVPSSAIPLTSRKNYDAILSVDRFTVVQTTQPVSIRASYGPFSTKQTVPARYIVPDAIDNQNDYLNNTTAALMELQQSNIHLDISAHLVRPAVSQDSPVLRVLFHTGADPRGHLQRQKICVLLHVSMGSMAPLKGRCMPEGEDGVCVAEVIIPSNWWPAIPSPSTDRKMNSQLKIPQKFAQISYSVFEPPLRNPEQCEPKIQIQPLTTFAQVPLIAATTLFKEIRADESLTILIPQYPLYPLSKIHVPVFLHQVQEAKISAFTMKARVKNGIKILGATSSSDFWNISAEKENQKHTTARVTAFKIESEISEEKQLFSDQKNNSAVEIFSWLLDIPDNALEGGKIVWSVQYVFENANTKEKSEINFPVDEGKRKLVAKFEINKDDIQAVLPMAKNWELMNTAVLTGRQVAQAMKVFIVSQAGKVADVTLQSSCHAEDESVIKVSSSCSSVYVDGSEIRGSSNASVIVKYGTYVGLAKFVVWMPEFPLEVFISDFRLSQIKGWKVQDENFHKQSNRRKKRSYVWGQHNTNYYNNMSGDKTICRARYQQSPVEVYARFLAIDQNSGRISYFISRRTGLCVTDLVQPLLRVADPKIACLKGRILQGKSMGRTDVQVLSPITGRVIGAKEVRVGSDKVSISKLVVNVVSGLQLTITPDNSIENGYISETSVTHKLTAQYQEGLLDIDLVFSDASKTPLRDVAVEDYFLLVESLDTEVVAFAPMLASHHPRVIAVGEGNGNLLRVTLLLSEDCRTRRNPIASKQSRLHNMPLASALANVEVDFDNVENVNKQDVVQNDGIIGRERKTFRNSGDLADIIVGTQMRDAIHHQEPTIQARQHRGGINFVESIFRNSKNGFANEMSSIEIGMYILLTAFCFAIIVFVISCVVYASKFRPVPIDSGTDQLDTIKRGINGNFLHDIRLSNEPTTNAHDWVWLGRSTLDRPSVISNASRRGNADDVKDWRMRITSNPFIMNKKSNDAHASFGINQQQNITSTKVLYANQQLIDSNVNKNPTDYRPPVPPHRNVGICANVQHASSAKDLTTCSQQKNFHKRNPSLGRVCRQLQKAQEKPKLSNSIIGTPSGPLPRPQQSPLQGLSLHEIISVELIENTSQNDMHNAEKLIERMNHHQKTAFQFDSLTPKRQPYKPDGNLNLDKNVLVSQDIKNEPAPKEAKDGMFVSSSKLKVTNSRKPRVKRATVVGNPMFTTSEEDGKAGESLGLDDLDMDYEQIMHYFHNLKESNA